MTIQLAGPTDNGYSTTATSNVQPIRAFQIDARMVFFGSSLMLLF
jgi:hypothetical protein